jgi:hypothetical protein
MKNRSRRPLVLLLVAQLALTACSATAHTPLPVAMWPQPKPVDEARQPPLVRATPNFQAPSATHCSRPVAMHEIPGWDPALGAARRDAGDRLAKAGRAEDAAVASTSRGGAPAAGAAPNPPPPHPPPPPLS